MASFTPDLDQLHELYRQYGADLFALCYLQAGRPAQALDLMATSLCDMAASPKLWELAASGKEGFLRVGHLNCVDASLRRPKRPKRKKDTSGQEAPRAVLPFSLTDPLREILKLRLPARTALFCRERLGLSWEAAAQLLGTSPARCQRLYGAALKQAKITAGQARANLETLSPGEDALDAAWEEFLSQRGQAGFAARQRYRRARRAMDVAMPFLALGVVAICVVAFLGVEHGWFGPSSVPVQGTAQESSSDDLPLEVGDVSVYVPEEGGFAEYIVHKWQHRYIHPGGHPFPDSGIFPGGGLPVRGGGGADAPGHGRHLRRLHPGPGPAVLPLPGRRADGKRKNRPGFPGRPADHHPHRGDGLPGVTYFSGGKPWRYSSKAPLGSVIS